jgi:malic enzyme
MTISDEDLYIAAKTLASCVTQKQLDMGNAYPPLNIIREVSAKIAAAVAKNVYDSGRNAGGKDVQRPADLLAYCKSIMYTPKY